MKFSRQKGLSRLPTPRVLVASVVLSYLLLLAARPYVTAAADVALLAPVPGGTTLQIIHGYNDPLPTEFCPRPGNGIADHCKNQKYGLDFSPLGASNIDILAPAPGRVSWISGDCLGLTLQDNTNLNVCHFSGSPYVSQGASVARGTPLGHMLDHIHLSLDDRNNTGHSSDPSNAPPLPFNGSHTIEGHSFDPGPDAQRDQHDGEVITSSNGGTSGGSGSGCKF